MIVVIGNLFFAIGYRYQYYRYTQNFNHKIARIVSKLEESYPDIEKSEWMEVLNTNEEEQETSFHEYGIDLINDSLILENDRYFIYFTIFNLGMFTFLVLVIYLFFIQYHRKKDRKLKEITEYIRQINRQNYQIDMDDHTEDELSILKSEIYKTTILLKETAQNSYQDKVNLKKSLSDISHQLKTPLTSIHILLDNLLTGEHISDKVKKEFLKDIKRETTNVQFLIEALLKLSKLDADTIHFINQEEMVEEVINDAIKKVELLAELKEITIQRKSANPNSKIICDKKWQVEAITNILKNSIEHSDVHSTITLSYEQNKLYTSIKIQDTGKGIHSKDLPHIFERFYVGKNSSSHGVGIGLALAKSMIEKNGGKITVFSKEGKGTTFLLRYNRMKTDLCDAKEI